MLVGGLPYVGRGNPSCPFVLEYLRYIKGSHGPKCAQMALNKPKCPQISQN